MLSEETQSATPGCELYIYALGKIIAEVRGNPTGQDEKYYYYQDNLGSTMLLTQQNGCEVFNQDYLPFGESLSRFGHATSFVQPGHKYTGQHEDMGTGLYYYNARYYDPEIGRFTREDEYQGSLDRPQTQHAFAYVSNNPMKYIDPTGYANEAGVGGGVGDDKWFKQLIEFFANGHSTKDKDRDKKIERIYGSQLLADVLQAESEYEGFSFDVDDYMFDGLRLENQIQMYLLMHTIVEEMGKDGVIGIAEQKDIMITRMVARSSFQYLNILEDTKSVFTRKADYYYSSEEIEDAIFEIECWYMFVAMAGFELAMMAASSENLEVTEATVQEAKGKANIASKIEANAAQQLAKMENGTPNAHYYSRHGAGTTLDQQYIRATTGLTPDGQARKPVDASRFLSNQLQLNAVQRAGIIYQQTGQTNFSFDMGKLIGEGYKAGSLEFIRTTNVHAVFRNGQLYTLYPKLSPLQ